MDTESESPHLVRSEGFFIGAINIGRETGK
jgi:hypothetical protein